MISKLTNKCQIEVENYNKIHEQQSRAINSLNFTDKTVLIGHSEQVYKIDICSQRNLLASGSEDYTVKVWNLQDYSLIQSFKNVGDVQDVVFSNEGNLLAFGDGGCQYNWPVKLVDISDLKKNNIIDELLGHTHDINRLAFSNDSKYLISGSCDRTVRIWDCKSKKEKFKLYQISAVQGVAIRIDDMVIASNTFDGKIRIWNFETKQILCTQTSDIKGCGIQFSNNLKILASSNRYGIVKLWNLEQLNQCKLILIRKLKVENNMIWTVLFSPCSKFILTINSDSTIKFLDTQTGQIVKEYKSNKKSDFIVHIDMARSKDMDIIAYPEDKNIVVLRMK